MSDHLDVLCKHCGHRNGDHDNPFDGGKCEVLGPGDDMPGFDHSLKQCECPGFDYDDPPKMAGVDDLADVLQRSIDKVKGRVTTPVMSNEDEMDVARRQRRK